MVSNVLAGNNISGCADFVLLKICKDSTCLRAFVVLVWFEKHAHSQPCRSSWLFPRAVGYERQLHRVQVPAPQAVCAPATRRRLRYHRDEEAHELHQPVQHPEGVHLSPCAASPRWFADLLEELDGARRSPSMSRRLTPSTTPRPRSRTRRATRPITSV